MTAAPSELRCITIMEQKSKPEAKRRKNLNAEGTANSALLQCNGQQLLVCDKNRRVSFFVHDSTPLSISRTIRCVPFNIALSNEKHIPVRHELACRKKQIHKEEGGEENKHRKGQTFSRRERLISSLYTLATRLLPKFLRNRRNRYDLSPCPLPPSTCR